MTKWWVELGDLYISSELIERILKEHEEAESWEAEDFLFREEDL